MRDRLPVWPGRTTESVILYSMTVANYAKLVGVSGLTIYNWEQGKSRPRKEQLAALAAVRGIGKREALAKLELIKAKEEKAAAKPKKKGRKKAKR